jgi:hypothetical protein
MQLPARPTGLNLVSVKTAIELVSIHAEYLVELCDITWDYDEMLVCWVELLKFVSEPKCFILYKLYPKKRAFWDYLEEMSQEVREVLAERTLLAPPSHFESSTLAAVDTWTAKRAALIAEWDSPDDDCPRNCYCRCCCPDDD